MPGAMKNANDASRTADSELGAAVLEGLSAFHKTLPCRFFYDARGSELFEAITQLPEYYPTRTERKILEDNAAEMTAAIPDGSLFVEFGSGSSRKTEILLARLSRLAAYIAIDVSPSALTEAKARLEQRFPWLDVRVIVGDFSRPLALPPELAAQEKTGFFPGSTIGNLRPAEAVRLLAMFRWLLRPSGRLIVGIDLKKDARRLVEAYDDRAGVTAAFNLNLLTRINRELGADFDLERFRHKALYNPREGRIEMHLESMTDQQVTITGHRIRFRKGELIHTESSYKYTIAEFENLARQAGWDPQQVWTDGDNLFSVHALR